MNQADPGAALIIISDAGATRGVFDLDRVTATEQSLVKIRKLIRRQVWVNPVPKVRWPKTTAGEIANSIPMFEMSRIGISIAVRMLRGNYQSSKGLV